MPKNVIIIGGGLYIGKSGEIAKALYLLSKSTGLSVAYLKDALEKASQDISSVTSIHYSSQIELPIINKEISFDLPKTVFMDQPQSKFFTKPKNNFKNR